MLSAFPKETRSSVPVLCSYPVAPNACFISKVTQYPNNLWVSTVLTVPGKGDWCDSEQNVVCVNCNSLAGLIHYYRKPVQSFLFPWKIFLTTSLYLKRIQSMGGTCL